MEEQIQDPRWRERSERTLECVLCNQLPEEAVSCSHCKRIFCWKHIKQLANCCYSCSTSPLGIICQTELQPEINHRRKLQIERERENSSKKQLSCKAYRCEYIGDYTSLLAHQLIRHPDLDINDVVFGIEHDREKELYLENKDNRILPPVELKPRQLISMEDRTKVHLTESDRETARFASIRRNHELPAGHRKKVPTEEQALNMIAHTKLCRSERCKQIWVGPWGTFIGGERGSTNFDLATCFEGRQLNESIGWDYLNPQQ